MGVAGSLTIHRVQRQTLPDGRRLPPIEAIEYIQADRKREEYRGYVGYRFRANGRDLYRRNPRTALVTRCDLGNVFLVNFDDGEYTTWPIPAFSTPEEIRARAGSVRQSPAQAPTILVETETVDTGERKELFGRPARHVITTQRILPVSGSRHPESQTVTDGWYIDLDTSLSCDPWWQSTGTAGVFLLGYKEGSEPDRPTFTNIGEAERGFVVVSRTTSGGSVLELEVTHLSTVTLDPILFEVPNGFSLVEQIRQEPVPPLVIRWKQAYELLKRRSFFARRSGVERH